jgi:hypothetical protein
MLYKIDECSLCHCKTPFHLLFNADDREIHQDALMHFRDVWRLRHIQSDKSTWTVNYPY